MLSVYLLGVSHILKYTHILHLPSPVLNPHTLLHTITHTLRPLLCLHTLSVFMCICVCIVGLNGVGIDSYSHMNSSTLKYVPAAHLHTHTQTPFSLYLSCLYSQLHAMWHCVWKMDGNRFHLWTLFCLYMHAHCDILGLSQYLNVMYSTSVCYSNTVFLCSISIRWVCAPFKFHISLIA